MRGAILELRRGQVPKVTWFCRAAYRVVLTGKEGIPAVILAIFSVIVAIDISLLSISEISTLKLVLVTLASIIVILVSTALSAIWALGVLPPTEYAQVLLAGRPATESLQIISRKILDACDSFRKLTKQFEDHPTDIENRKIRKLSQQLANRQGTLVRLSALMDVASAELDIPLTRLRDRLFEYDPAAHRSYGRQYIRNLEALQKPDRLTPEMKESLGTENSKIVELARTIQGYQKDLTTYTSLDQDILYLAAVHSTSEAVQQYARALSSIAYHTIVALGKDKNTYSESRSEQLRDAARAVRFLLRKQHSHSGFDLDQLCLTLSQTRDIEVGSGVLRDLRDIFSRAHPVGEAGPFWPLSDLGHGDVDGYPEAVRKIESLQVLWGLTNEVIWASRKTLSKRFTDYYSEWRHETSSTPKIVLVTHGFSSTVKCVLKSIFRDDPSGGRANERDVPRMFIVRSQDDGDLDSRLMAVALRQIRDARIDVAVAEVESLTAFLDKETKVLVLLGAECFDDDRRVVHPQGLDMGKLKERLADASSHRIVILAEEYKHQRDLLAHSRFYRYHLDRIKLYKPELVNSIITNTRILDDRLIPFSVRRQQIVAGHTTPISLACRLVDLTCKPIVGREVDWTEECEERKLLATTHTDAQGQTEFNYRPPLSAGLFRIFASTVVGTGKKVTATVTFEIRVH